MLAEHNKNLELALGNTPGYKIPEKKFTPMKFAKNVVEEEDIPTKMRKYAKRNRKIFNPS